MKRNIAFALAGLMTMFSLSISAMAAADTTAGKKPDASPGWWVIEEDFWTPLRFEPLISLDSAGYHYRRDEEIAAANQIDKAVSWLKLAAGHAMPITKKKLTTASGELTKIAKDLRAGRVTKAADMDSALARAAHALGEWHYYKSKEAWGKSEAEDAATNLHLAAEYLQHAADSAHYHFGPDTQKIVTKTYLDGKETGKTTHYDHNVLGKDLQEMANAVKELGAALRE